MAEYQVTEFKVTSSFDGLTLKALKVAPRLIPASSDVGTAAHAEAQVFPKAAVVFAHGMAEHKERYLPFMQYLADHGYVSYIHDHRGHGGSVKSAGDLGFLYDKGEDGLIEDLHQMVLLAHEENPDRPVLLFGHSMGSLIVRIFLADYDRDIDGLLVSGCVAANPAAGAGKTMAKLFGKLKGDHYRSSMLQKTAFGSYNKQAGADDSVPNAWLTTDGAVVAAYNADPLCGYNFTTNGYVALMTLMQRCYEKDRFKVAHPDLPILFLSGGSDPCRASDEGFRKAVDFLKGLGYQEVSGQLFEGMRHEILNETNKEEVYSAVLAFFDRAAEK